MSENQYLSEHQAERLRDGLGRLSSNTLSVLGVLIILTVVLTGIFAPWVAPYPDAATGTPHFDEATQSPSAEHLMGTDRLGRDIFSRVLYGARISILMGVVVLTIAIGIGVPLGLVAGYLGGRIGAIIMRTTDIFLAIPPIVLALAVAALVEPTLWNAMIAIAFAWWPWYTRLTNGEVISVKQEEFVEASESIGASWPRITFREILPNILAPLTVKASLDMGFVILVGAALAFLGLGATPPTPSWGAMIAQGRDYITTYWWMSTFPGLAISFTVLGFNFLGDGLRDLFDVEVNRYE